VPSVVSTGSTTEGWRGLDRLDHRGRRGLDKPDHRPNPRTLAQRSRRGSGRTQPGYWNPTAKEVENLREYLLRGGFLMLDDFHGGDWDQFEYSIRRVFPDRELVDIPREDAAMQIFFSIDQRTQIPGDRHLGRFGRFSNGEVEARMEGPPEWRGIYDDRGRLMVVANYNMDIGDAWEHADDPGYPLPMTAFAYQLGVNYVIYVLSH